MLSPVYDGLVRARLAHPGWMLPQTHYSPHVYIQAGGPFGAFLMAKYLGR